MLGKMRELLTTLLLFLGICLSCFSNGHRMTPDITVENNTTNRLDWMHIQWGNDEVQVGSIPPGNAAIFIRYSLRTAANTNLAVISFIHEDTPGLSWNSGRNAEVRARRARSWTHIPVDVSPVLQLHQERYHLTFRILSVTNAVVLVEKNESKSLGEVSFEMTTELRDKVIANPRDDASLRELVSLLDDNAAINRANAAGCLRQLGENRLTRGRVAPIVVPALARRIDYVGREALIALAAYGSLALPAVPQLIRAVEQYATQDKGWFAAEALGNIGPAAKDAIPALTAARDKEWIGEYAAEALRKINGR